MKDCQCTQLVNSSVYDGTVLKAYTLNFWSVITANIAKLLVMPPYMVKSFVGFGLMTNQIRYVAIKITEALRLLIVKVSQLIGIGGLY